MEFSFVPMTEEYARVIVDTWKYDAEYSVYDYSNEADHVLDSRSWGIGLLVSWAKTASWWGNSQ